MFRLELVFYFESSVKGFCDNSDSEINIIVWLDHGLDHRINLKRIKFLLSCQW